MKRSEISRTIVAVAMMLIGWLPSLAYGIGSYINNYDFVIDEIYFKRTGTNTASVTYKDRSVDGTFLSDYVGNVVIPEIVNYNEIAYSVTSIDNSAFRDCIDLTGVEIPNSVTSIGKLAFYDC